MARERPCVRRGGEPAGDRRGSIARSIATCHDRQSEAIEITGMSHLGTGCTQRYRRKINMVFGCCWRRNVAFNRRSLARPSQAARQIPQKTSPSSLSARLYDLGDDATRDTFPETKWPPLSGIFSATLRAGPSPLNSSGRRYGVARRILSAPGRIGVSANVADVLRCSGVRKKSHIRRRGGEVSFLQLRPRGRACRSL